ncbi:hypothetical protein DL771_006007 [Monosporascus sp. 5C6A]|nr:hypothetical protein DL771_006007 [Monosporascus sp. 5C6A]
MTTQLLATELANLIQESKRKHNDLRQAAEKSLEELKSIRAANEAQVAAELSQRANFVNPFVIACGTKNVKFTGIAIVCLLRLIVVSALPRSRLNSILEALREATSAGVDAQLKILQVLPTLLQNYSVDIKGDLLVTALNICFILQTSKNGIINNTSAATLQQLVVSVFDKVVTEDKSPSDNNYIGDAPTQDGAVNLRAAAMDAYHVFKDICLMTENKRPEYLRFSGLPQTFGLELIESVLTSHASIFSAHPEQAHVLRTQVIPFITESLTGKQNFATSVRLVRIMYTLLRRHLGVLSSEGGDALEILTQIIDQDSAVWKRALCMEVFRGIFAEPALLRRIFMLYDAREGERNVLKDITATFVRISTEKPVVIGLGHQSTIPVANPYSNNGGSTDQAMLEASGVTGIISGSVGTEGQNIGISSQWSIVRVPCIDQLDKTEPPPTPESYIYALTLSCITSLSEGLAKFILPLTVPSDNRPRRRNPRQQDVRSDSPGPEGSGSEAPKSIVDRAAAAGRIERSGSFKRNPVPVNPLSLKDHPLYVEVKVCADIIDECWPAILATCSTFLYAALDSEYYHGLVRAFQKFAHVAGLLQLATPRDAFLTTLGKAAVPPNTFTACLNAGSSKAAPLAPTADTRTSLLSNARGLLSVDNLVTPVGAAGERQRQASMDASTTPQTLNTRNLLCLRALINLGIALGPTLGPSWRIILETLQQADFILFTTGKSAGRTPVAVSKISDPRADSEAASLLANFNTEIRSVESATVRLFESTVDFPNNAFIEIVTAVCNLVERPSEPASEPSSRPQSPQVSTQGLKSPTGQHRRVLSLSGTTTSGSNQEYQFALAKLGDVANINIERLLMYPPDASGWQHLTAELIATLSSSSMTPPVRNRAADILVRLVVDAAKAATGLNDEPRGKVQLRLLEALRDSLVPLQQENRQTSVADQATDVDIHKIMLEGLKSLVEGCGETLISGWEIAFEIIDSIFLRRGSADGVWSTILSGSLGFLTSFFPQTVTFFWVLSDFLSGKSKSLPITDDLVGKSDESALVETAARAENASSNAALWMLLLLRLTTVTTDERPELRNSAIQTLLRIFDAYGDKLSPEAWSVCIKSVIFKLFSSVEKQLRSIDGPEVNNQYRRDWYDTAVVVLSGISDLLANNLGVLTAHPTFNSYWQQLLGHFASLLDFRVLEINTATFKALAQILSHSQGGAKQNFNKKTVGLAWDLWSRGVPVADAMQEEDNKTTDNQSCLLAYVAALREVYHLIQADLTVEHVRKMLALLHEATQMASPGAFVHDIDNTTPLQGQILDVVKRVRTDVAGAPAALVSQTSEFISLAFADTDTAAESGRTKRTYVAMSKASMEILQSLLINHASDPDIYLGGAFLSALTSLSKPIVLKYQFPIVTKSVQPWRQATTSVLAILQATLPQLRVLDLPPQTLEGIWEMIVTIANGITNADCDGAPDKMDIKDDEAFDISSFFKLRDLILPSLGAEIVPEKTRRAFAESLFRMSIVHAPAPTEHSIVYGNSDNDVVGLGDLYKARRGHTIDPLPTKRDKMCYVCLDELFSLVSSHDEASTPSIMVEPPTPGFPPPNTVQSFSRSAKDPETPHALCVRLARTAAPYLILRAALTLRAYAADQPLRGRMPQPLSQRRELARILERLVDLRSEPSAITDVLPGIAGSEGTHRKHLLRLYPLLVRAAGVAGAGGDAEALGLLRAALEVVGGELGV